jgi:hypothetical protein
MGARRQSHLSISETMLTYVENFDDHKENYDNRQLAPRS